jgi:hypothetical protein
MWRHPSIASYHFNDWSEYRRLILVDFVQSLIWSV